MSITMLEESNTNTSKKNVSRDVVEAVNLLAQGKRNMMCGEVAHAANQLQEACRILDKEYGDGADECADAYFWYGKALLEVSRLEGGVLGDAVPGGDSEASSQSSKNDDDEDDDDEEADENGAANSSINDGTDEEGALSEDIENEEADVTESEKIKKSEEKTVGEESSKVDKKCGDAEVAAAAAAEGEQDNDNGSVGDDVSNLQLAWEMMECAKVIYMKHDMPEMKLKLADTYSKLGEIGMETEQYEQSISDLGKCLDIQLQLLPADDRRLAETRYQLGLVCTFDKRYDAAVDHYRRAIEVIQSKMAHLNRIASGDLPPDAGADPDGFDTPQQLAAKEAEELASIIPDLEAKIEDVEDERRNADQVMKLMKESVALTSSGGTTSSGGEITSSSGECSTSSRFVPPPSELGSLFSTFGGFSAPAFSSSELPSASVAAATQPINNISHLVRKKRKPDDEVTDVDTSKKTKIPMLAPVVDSANATIMTGGNGDHSKKPLEDGSQIVANNTQKSQTNDVTAAKPLVSND